MFVCIKEPLQFDHHLIMPRLARRRRVRGRQQSPFQRIKIKMLEVGKTPSQRFRTQELAQHGFIDSLVVHLIVIRRVFAQQSFVPGKKGRRFRPPIIPHQDHPAVRTQNPRELGPATFAVEPMKCLPRDNKIHAALRECRRFRGSGNALEMSLLAQQPFRRFAHLTIRLNAKNPITICQKQFAENARARTDVGDARFAGKSAFTVKEINDLTRISRTIADVVRNAIRKTLRRVSR